MWFPTEFIDEVRARISIVDLIGQSVRLKKQGAKYVALCPFHNEKTPSFHVFPGEEHYHCFGCGAHGNVFTFLMNHTHLTFAEAVERLASMAGLPLPAQAESTAEAQAYEETIKLNQLALTFFLKHLHQKGGEQAREYCRMRGLSEDTISHFSIGYAPNEWEGLKKHLLKEGFNEEALLKAGLVTQHEETKRVYDRFRDRLMFPIYDHQERVIAFGGRSLTDQMPKYLNSPETVVFKKSSVLYNRARARRALKGDGNAIVVEGYMDVIGLYEFGFHEAVAPLGTAFTGEHLRALWKFSPEPLICLDGDEAGQKAMDRIIDIALPLLEPGKSLQFINIPEGDDPDSFLRKTSAHAFKERVKAATPLFERLVMHEEKKTPLDTPERKAGLIGRLRAKGEIIKDGLTRRMYKSFLDEKFPEASFQPRNKVALPPLPKSTVNAPGSLKTRHEQVLILGILLNPELLGEQDEALSGIQFKDEMHEKIRGTLLQYSAEQHPLEKKQLESYLKAMGFTEFVMRLYQDKGVRELFPFLNSDPKAQPFKDQWIHLLARVKSTGDSQPKMASAELFDEDGWARFLEQRHQKQIVEQDEAKKLGE